MSEEIKAIETYYNGYRFRSRLEARWAVFFDSLAIEYQYEPQGFRSDGKQYLPDFYLPAFDIYCEVKPDTKDGIKSLVKPISMLKHNTTFSKLLVLSEIPREYDGSNYVFPCYEAEKDRLVGVWYSFTSFVGYLSDKRDFLYVPIDYHVSLEFLNHHFDEGVAVTLLHDNTGAGMFSKPTISASTLNRVNNRESNILSDNEKLDCFDYLQNEPVYQAFKNASTARFEFGEIPKTEIDCGVISIRHPSKLTWEGCSHG